MAVFGYVDGGRLPPSEQEVADRRSHSDSQAQPHVVRHEDQHQTVAEDYLQEVQNRLEAVVLAHHVLPGQTNHLISMAVFQR